MKIRSFLNYIGFGLLGIALGVLIRLSLSMVPHKASKDDVPLGISNRESMIKKTLIIQNYTPPVFAAYEDSNHGKVIHVNTSSLLSNIRVEPGARLDCILLKKDSHDGILQAIDDFAYVVDWEKNTDPRGMRITPPREGEFDYYAVLIRETRPIFEDVPGLKFNK